MSHCGDRRSQCSKQPNSLKNYYKVFFLECSSSMFSLVNTSYSTLSPFGSLYLNNLSCMWVITAPQHQIIKFWFTKFDLAQPGDYITIQDGGNNSSAVIKNFTTTPDLDQIWVSSGSHLFVKFHSDADGVATGFSLIWMFSDIQKG